MRLIQGAAFGLLRMCGQALRVVIIGILVAGLAGVGITFANYLATQGAGTTFASVVISGTHYLANLLCDPVAGQSSCAGVIAGSGAASTSNAALVTTLSPSSAGFIAGQSNAGSAVATGATNLPSIAYGFGFNGTTWDQLQVDGSKNLKVTSAGSQSNASSAVATSSTNAANVGWMYGFNGTTWDQLQVDASKYLKVTIAAQPTIAIDPCQALAKTSVAISQAANTKIFSAVTAKKNYICSYQWNAADAENISLVEGTGSVCGSSTAAIIGGTTAATGNNFAANSGAAGGSGGYTVVAGNNANFDVCLLQSGSGRVAGFLTYVQQ